MLQRLVVSLLSRSVSFSALSLAPPLFFHSGVSATGVVSAMQKTLLEPADYPFELAVKDGVQYDPAYPGTAVQRLSSVLKRVKELPSLDGPWNDVRRHLLAAGGLKEDQSTSHAFNDDNHCDLTTMVDSVSFNDNSNGAVAMISRGNRLGPHISRASLQEHGPGGSWSTCTNGAHLTPPSDVAHVQFSSRVAFKLVWVPPEFTQFVLVDDEGKLLKHGTPTGNLPHPRSRQGNYELVRGGKYASVADRIAAGELPSTMQQGAIEASKICDNALSTNKTLLVGAAL